MLPPAAATAISWLLDPLMSVAGLSMVYLVAVAAAALVLPRAPAAASALLCVGALNCLFVPPRGSWNVQDPEHWWILATLLGLSLAIATLVDHLRRQRREAELARSRSSELHRLSEAMAAVPAHQAMTQAADFLHALLGRACVVFLRQGEGAALTRYASPEGAPFQEQPAAWAIANGRTLGRGCPDWPDLPLWCAPFTRHGSNGAVQILLGERDRPAPADLEHWQALTRQAGLAIERARAFTAASNAEQSARSETARNTLLASLSHDMRTPLAGIVGTASTLRAQGDAMPAGQRQRLLANLEDEAQDMAVMADNILQIARLSQPQSQLRLQWESLDDILGAAVARMRRRWPEANIQLKVPPSLPPVKVEAGLLAQAVANLIDNAARHGGSPPRVTVQAGRSRSGVFVAVRDHGAGLPPGDPAALFERWRVQGAAGAGGAGLGLAICRLAVQAHAGTVQASPCEPGAEFRIDLPVTEAPAPA